MGEIRISPNPSFPKRGGMNLPLCKRGSKGEVKGTSKVIASFETVTEVFLSQVLLEKVSVLVTYRRLSLV
jgi:hypothetical protein